MEKKITRGEQYREILGKLNYTIGEVEVLSFHFQKESGPEIFHYDIMDSCKYILFDCRKDKATANVIIEKTAIAEREKIIEKAGRSGGTLINPDLS